jgi:hypothetical protein
VLIVTRVQFAGHDLRKGTATLPDAPRNGKLTSAPPQQYKHEFHGARFMGGAGAKAEASALA